MVNIHKKVDDISIEDIEFLEFADDNIGDLVLWFKEAIREIIVPEWFIFSENINDPIYEQVRIYYSTALRQIFLNDDPRRLNNTFNETYAQLEAIDIWAQYRIYEDLRKKQLSSVLFSRFFIWWGKHFFNAVDDSTYSSYDENMWLYSYMNWWVSFFWNDIDLIELNKLIRLDIQKHVDDKKRKLWLPITRYNEEKPWYEHYEELIFRKYGFLSRLANERKEKMNDEMIKGIDDYMKKEL